MNFILYESHWNYELFILKLSYNVSMATTIKIDSHSS
jgi:hypothetical protein